MSTPAQPNYACSFCGKQQSQVRRLIAGPSNSARGIYICDECVRLCAEILDEEEGKGPAEWKQEPPKPSSSPARP